MLQQLGITLKITLQISFKCLCRVHESSMFTDFSFLILESKRPSEDGDETAQEQLFLQDARELPMEGLRPLGV